MKTRLMLMLLVGAASLAMFAFAGPGFADPPGMLVSPPNHRHFLVKPDGTRVPVGPQICGHPEMQQAFDEFHYNIHHSQIPPGTAIETLGPQNGAPGLHNGQGGEIIGVPGCA